MKHKFTITVILILAAVCLLLGCTHGKRAVDDPAAPDDFIPGEVEPGDNNTKPDPPASKEYSVSFIRNLNGEDESDGFCRVIRTDGSGKISAFPVEDSYDALFASGEDIIFAGWYTKAEGGERVDKTHIFTKDTVLYAHWIYIHTVIFNGNGGEPQHTGLKTDKNGQILDRPTVTRPGYSFSGWYTKRVSGEYVGDDYVFGGDITEVFAWWTYVGGSFDAPYTITFDAAGGTLDGVSERTTDKEGRLAVKDIPAASAVSYDADHEFIGWFTSPYVGLQISEYFVFTGNITVYAHWRIEILPVSICVNDTLSKEFALKQMEHIDYIYPPHVDFDITLNVSPAADIMDALSREDAPDLFIYDSRDLVALADAGYLAPLSAEDQEQVINSYSPDLVEAFMYGGKLYGYPKTINRGWVFWYDNTYFTASDVATLDGIFAKATADKQIVFPYGALGSIFHTSLGCDIGYSGSPGVYAANIAGAAGDAANEALYRCIVSNRQKTSSVYIASKTVGGFISVPKMYGEGSGFYPGENISFASLPSFATDFGGAEHYVKLRSPVSGLAFGINAKKVKNARVRACVEMLGRSLYHDTGIEYEIYKPEDEFRYIPEHPAAISNLKNKLRKEDAALIEQTKSRAIYAERYVSSDISCEYSGLGSALEAAVTLDDVIAALDAFAQNVSCMGA